jgi:hypothetical protein
MNTNLDPQDLILRVLIVFAGALAATLLMLKGQAQMVPALAIGGMLGAFFMARFDQTGEE